MKNSRCKSYKYDDSSDEEDREQPSVRPKAKNTITPGPQIQARLPKEKYLPSQPALDIEIPSDQFTSERQGLSLCCCNMTYPEIRGCTKLVFYVLTFLLILFLGGVIWHFIQTKNGDDPDQFFKSPWVWPESNISVGVYYYPWHKDDFHRGSGYLRKQLSTVQQPVLGEYDDSDPVTIYQHFKWSAQANVGLWVTSWWGPGTREDMTTKDVILQHSALGDLKIALFYESTGRIKENDGYSTHRVIPDLEYMARNYFNHPNYYRIDGRPVLFVYLTRKLEGLGVLDHVVEQMRQAARDEGHNLYIVGDHVFHRAPQEDSVHTPFTILDAVTNYDIYGSMSRPSPYATEPGVREHFKRAREWKVLAAKQKCAFIPSVSPGYNDLGVRPEKGHGPLSRRLSADEAYGSLLKTALQYARRLIDPSVGNLIMVNSFNEWHEDTQIEPVEGEATALPETVTQGIEYQGYGEHYLNILREETSEL